LEEFLPAPIHSPLSSRHLILQYPCSNTTPSRPRLQHLLPKIDTPAPMSVSHPSSIRPFFIFKPRHHAFPNASSSKRETTLLPNDNILPTADAFTGCFEENLLPNGAFSTKLGPQVSPFPVPIFGVNKRYRGYKGWVSPHLVTKTLCF
jgi:hypothetical protein